MDNRLFNVNGEGEDMLRAALNLAFSQRGERLKCEAWRFTKKHGLILLWNKSDDAKSNAFPEKMTADEVIPMVLAWLKSEQAKTVELGKWEDADDHDGDNGKGWRVYVEDWGHVDGDFYAICAVKPVYLWFGK